jgi:hypothetical protein
MPGMDKSVRRTSAAVPASSRVQRLGSVRGGRYTETLVHQVFREHLAHQILIIDHQHPNGHRRLVGGG